MLEYFIAHRSEVVTRRTKFDLTKAQEREHILLGLKKALDHIDEIIKLIKKIKDVDDARLQLMKEVQILRAPGQRDPRDAPPEASPASSARRSRTSSTEVQTLIEEIDRASSRAPKNDEPHQERDPRGHREIRRRSPHQDSYRIARRPVGAAR